MEELLIVTTGGTIDKIYFDDKSDYQIGDPQIGQILKELGVAFRFTVIPIIRKECAHHRRGSRTDPRHRRRAAGAPRADHPRHRFDGADRPRAQVHPGQDIVMTGALNPARFRGSDAEFNIGCAVGAVQSLPPGVYIAMNGRIWDPAKVRKNVAANRFEAA